MRNILITAAALSLSGGAGFASTFTFNNINAYCAGGTGTCVDAGGSLAIADQLTAGAVYGLTDPTMIDGAGDPYAARVTIVETGGPTGSNHSSINVSPLNAWTHYRFEFVESFDIVNRTFGADLTVKNIESLVIQDIDSNAGADFTDVAGVNLAIETLGSALELGGFGPNTPGNPNKAGFNFVRLDQNGDGSWTQEDNVPAAASQADKDAVSAIFGVDGDLAGFEFIWGSTGSSRGGNVRGWDLAINAELDPFAPPIPLPASLPLLLAGVGGLVWTKRRRKAA